MQLLGYWRLLLQNKALISICTVVGFVAAIMITSTTTPLYQSSVQLFISTPAASLDISTLATGASFSQQRVKSYAQIINSPLTLEPVIQRLGLKMSATALSGQISASAPLDTVLISLTVTDGNPQRAADIANAVAKQFAVTATNLEIRSTTTASMVKVSTVREAIPASAPSSPKKTINFALGLLLGFGLGIGLASLRRLLDNTIKNEEDLDGTPLLAAIGFDALADEKPLITDIGRYAARTESFRTLRTNLKFVRPDAPPKVIAVTSSLSEEGKTTSAINLALSLAQGGSRTLFIEADLRRPKAPSYLEIPNRSIGLSELLSHGKKLTNVLVNKAIAEYEEHKLMVMLSGKIPPNPTELLGADSFDELLTILRKIYDYIIIDCPPTLPITDATVVASKTDGAILIVHAGVTKEPQFLGACAAITAGGSSILGVVLNKIPESSLEYGYRYVYPRYYGQNYGPKSGLKTGESLYSPIPEELERMEREEFFERVAGKRFKDELSRDSKKRI